MIADAMGPFAHSAANTNDNKKETSTQRIAGDVIYLVPEQTVLLLSQSN